MQLFAIPYKCLFHMAVSPKRPAKSEEQTLDYCKSRGLGIVR
jgi:hypothetical protein